MSYKCKLGIYFMVSDHEKLNGVLIYMIGCVWTLDLHVFEMAAKGNPPIFLIAAFAML